jgi:hypothetical protein
MDDFCALSRYAPNDIDTDAKRKEKFLNGLKGELKIPLSVAYAPRPSHWTTTSGRKRTIKGNLATARTMWNHSTRSTTHLRAVDMVVHTSMGAVSAREVVVTSMAIRTMENSRETTPMVITMDTMVSTTTTQKPRRISHTLPVSSTRRLDTLQTIVLR